MPIRNSVVQSAELFGRKRKNRLNTYHGNDDATDETSDRSEANPPIPDPETDRRADGGTDGGVPDATPDDQDRSVEGSHKKVQVAEEQGSAQLDDKDALPPDFEEEVVSGRRQKKPRKVAAKRLEESGQISLKMNVAYPAVGISPTFDQLAELQGEKAAFRLVLGKALDLYAASIMDGTAQSGPATYPQSPTPILTSRMFPEAAYAAFARQFDQAGLASKRIIGTAIGRRAMAAFVARDGKPD